MMGRYDSDDDRRRSRRDRDRKYRRSRSRGRSPPDKRRGNGRRHNTRSRSRSKERRRRSRERHRETKGERDTRRHRNSSKSRRGQYSDSKSCSRSRSRDQKSRSPSTDRERRQKDKINKGRKSTQASKSKASVKDKDSHKDDAGIKNSKLSIPSADTLAKIESNSFVPETFVPQKSKKGENEDTVNSRQNQSHEDAIFGVSGREPLSTDTVNNNKPNEINHEPRTEGSGIMASLLNKSEESKNDKWIKKLYSMRQKKLKENSERLLS